MTVIVSQNGDRIYTAVGLCFYVIPSATCDEATIKIDVYDGTDIHKGITIGEYPTEGRANNILHCIAHEIAQGNSVYRLPYYSEDTALNAVE